MKSVCALILGLLAVVSANAQSLKPPKETALDRFLRYVKIDTQSAEDQTTVPSTQEAAQPREPARERIEGHWRTECSRQ